MEIDPNMPPFSRLWWVASAARALRDCFDPQRLDRLLHIEGYPMFRESARTIFKVDADHRFTDDEIRWMYDYLNYQYEAKQLAQRN